MDSERLIKERDILRELVREAHDSGAMHKRWCERAEKALEKP
jgi:hypothetical protein